MRQTATSNVNLKRQDLEATPPNLIICEYDEDTARQS